MTGAGDSDSELVRDSADVPPDVQPQPDRFSDTPIRTQFETFKERCDLPGESLVLRSRPVSPATEFDVVAMLNGGLYLKADRHDLTQESVGQFRMLGGRGASKHGEKEVRSDPRIRQGFSRVVERSGRRITR